MFFGEFPLFTQPLQGPDCFLASGQVMAGDRISLFQGLDQTDGISLCQVSYSLPYPAKGKTPVSFARTLVLGSCNNLRKQFMVSL